MQIDTAMVGIFVPVFLVIVGLAYGYGILTNKVKANRNDITDIQTEFREYKRDNKSDHTLIFGKLEEILKNGKRG